MSEEDGWRSKEEMMAHLSRGERTLQAYVKDGRLERRIGEDKRAYYRVAQQVAAPQRDAAEAPPWAVELLEEIRGLKAEIASLKAPPQLPASVEEQEEVHIVDTPRSEPQQRSDPQRGWWARLFGGRK